MANKEDLDQDFQDTAQAQRAAQYFASKRDPGKPKGKEGRQGGRGWGEKLWKTAGTIQTVGNAARELSSEEEDAKNPYLDESVFEMLAYVSRAKSEAKKNPEKTTAGREVTKVDTVNDGQNRKRSTVGGTRQQDPSGAKETYAERSNAEGVRVQETRSPGVSAEQYLRHSKERWMSGGDTRKSYGRKTANTLVRNESEERPEMRNPSEHLSNERVVSNSDTGHKENVGRNVGTEEVHQIPPSRAAQVYQETGKSTTDHPRSTTAKNAGKKTANSRIKGTGTSSAAKRTAETAAKTGKSARNVASERPGALSFVQAVYQVGQKIKEEGFGKKNQERQFQANEKEILAYAQNEVQETSKKAGNLFITLLFALPIFPILLLIIILCVFLSGSSTSQGTGLSAQYDAACYLAAKYESGGNPDQTGGDGGNACGEFQFDNRYELGPFVSWCYARDATFYAPFQPFLGMTTELKSNDDFYQAWHTVCATDMEVFEAAQCEYVYTQTLMPLLQAMTDHYGYDFVNCSDALKGCILSFGNRDGKYVASLRRYFDGTTATSTEREIIERAYNAMIARRPHIQRWRLEKLDCLALLDGVLDVYEPSSNAAGSIDWSWKRIAGGSEVGNLVAQIAVSKVGCGYSQAHRDDEGWYDCSSLVYRCYAEAGITYLNGKTAADEAQYLVEHGMTVTREELQPGDIIFYSYGTNGRYRNISHVAIYIGNDEMVHAANESRGVVRDPFRPSNLTEPLYARPQ